MHRIYSIKHNFHGKCLDSRQHSVLVFEITNSESSIAVFWCGRWFLKIYISMSGVIREILKWQVFLVTRLASVNEMWFFLWGAVFLNFFCVEQSKLFWFITLETHAFVSFIQGMVICNNANLNCLVCWSFHDRHHWLINYLNQMLWVYSCASYICY